VSAPIDSGPDVLGIHAHLLASIPGVLVLLDARGTVRFASGQVEHLAALQTQLVEKLKAETWVKPKVDLLPAGSLPVAEGKAKRVIDKRSL